MTTAEPTNVEEMFVQVARGSFSDDKELTLTGLSSSTLYFSDRPERVVGHMTADQFVELWTQGENSFPAVWNGSWRRRSPSAVTRLLYGEAASSFRESGLP
jgi:hypothetical protein